jgi:iron(III) transport system ATP-binding protein
LPRQEARIEEMLALIQMQGELGSRKPSQLSGGQQQRVALARALAVEPKCLLLDEPLSNLDTILRHEMRREIQRICKQTGITTLYVTHDQKEALSCADRIAVLQDGKLVQVGTPVELYQSPATAFVADFVGRTNLLEGEIVAFENGSIHIATAAGRVVATKGPPSGRVILSIRPERVRIVAKEDPPGANRVTGALLESSFLGESSEHVVGVGGVQMRVIAAPPRLNVAGDVALEFAAADVVVLAR